MNPLIKTKAEELIDLLDAEQKKLTAEHESNPNKKPRTRYASAIFIGYYDEDKETCEGISVSTGFSDDIMYVIDKGTEKSESIREIIHEAVCRRSDGVSESLTELLAAIKNCD